MRERFLLTVFAILCFYIGAAQTTSDPTKLYKEDLSKLSGLVPDKDAETETSLAGFTNTSLRNTPAVVTVISAQDIEQMGARDLVDVLRFVPGFSFSQDVNLGVGLSVRGNWAFEGRFLIMLNGMQLNETVFGTFPFGQHVALNNIDRIEIIRGAGAAKFGGLAALAVINIVTKDGAKSQGIMMATTLGVSEGGVARSYFEASAVQQYGNGIYYAGNARLASGVRSNFKAQNDHGEELHYGDVTGIQNGQLSFALGVKNFKFQVLFDQFEYEEFHTNRVAISQTFGFDVKYDGKISDKVDVFSQLTFKADTPRLTEIDVDSRDDNHAGDTTAHDEEEAIGETLAYEAIFNTITKRLNAIAGVTIKPSDKIGITIGVQGYTDFVKHRVHLFELEDHDQANSFLNVAGFGEIFAQTKFANLSAGLRIDKFDGLEPVLVQRYAATRSFGKFHAKAIYNTSFKQPTRQTIELLEAHGHAAGHEDEELVPERINLAELELGYRFSDRLSITANLFSLNIDRTIISEFEEEEDPQGGGGGGHGHEEISEVYVNSGLLHTNGVELTGRYQFKERGALSASYSNYFTTKNTVPQVSVLDNDRVITSTPPHIVNVYAYLPITKNLSILPSFMFQSKKYGYSIEEEHNTQTNEEELHFHLEELDPVYLFTLGFQYKNLFTRGLDFSFSAYNLLNEKLYFVSPNRIGHAPFPDQGLEFNLKVIYNIKMN